MTEDEIKTLAENVMNGNRRALAKAITLVESQNADDERYAGEMLSMLNIAKPAIRVGLSGTPGVGKSTFIDAFGMMLIEKGLRVAVLAVDPSSSISGGSILGDKTRMASLSRAKNAFIRPSPSQNTLGGVARRSPDVIRVLEAAGYDVILVETVGVGQSEVMVGEMTDIFVLLLAPAGGDELQGVKRGIMERADLIVVNKADGELKPDAERTRADYAGALKLMRKKQGDPVEFPKALAISALEENGLETVWENIETLFDWRNQQGRIAAERAKMAKLWFEREFITQLEEEIRRHPDWQANWDVMTENVESGAVNPRRAAKEMLAQFQIEARR